MQRDAAPRDGSARRLPWRRREAYGVFHRVLEAYLGKPDFRVCHISIQQSHVHLLVEAVHRKALSRNNWRRHREEFANGALVPAYLDESRPTLVSAGAW